MQQGRRTTAEVRRSATRFVTRTELIETRHAFSFGRHYDPANTGHGLLLALNDDRLAAGGGYGSHPHRDVEVVTWVLEGALVHEDSSGRRGVVHPGEVQRMSAGSGVLHSERNHAAQAGPDLRLVQMWVAPRQVGGAPEHEHRDLTGALRGGELVPVASGLPRHRGSGCAGLRSDAALHVARLGTGGSVVLPDAPSLHVFLARGGAELEGAGSLAEGDAVRLTGTGGQRLQARGEAEVLVWEMHGRSR